MIVLRAITATPLVPLRPRASRARLSVCSSGRTPVHFAFAAERPAANGTLSALLARKRARSLVCHARGARLRRAARRRAHDA